MGFRRGLGGSPETSSPEYEENGELDHCVCRNANLRGDSQHFGRCQPEIFSWGFRGNTNLAGVERLGDRVLVAPFDGARQGVLCRSVLNPAQHGGFGGDPFAPDLPSRQFALREKLVQWVNPQFVSSKHPRVSSNHPVCLPKAPPASPQSTPIRLLKAPQEAVKP